MSGQDYKISNWAGERHDNLGVTLEYNVKLDDSFSLSRKLNKIINSLSNNKKDLDERFERDRVLI